MTGNKANNKDLSERDEQHLSYVPEDLDFLALADKLRIGRPERMRHIIGEHAIALVSERLPQEPGRQFTREEVLAIVSWTARAAVEGALDYDVLSEELLPHVMGIFTNDPRGSLNDIPAQPVPILNDTDKP